MTRSDSSSRARQYRFRAAWWLPGGHAQTIWSRFARRHPAIALRRECLVAPDGDNVEIHELSAAPAAPRILMLHGLEGSLESHYVGGVFAKARARGWGAVLMMHRGCGSAPNLARRFYHSGETSDVAQVFATMAGRYPASRWGLFSVSLGGNVLLKWLGELGDSVDPRIAGAMMVSVPYDLEAGARYISNGFSRVYDRRFLRTLREKALAKLARYPDLFDRGRLMAARNVFEFDDAVTAPVHGFRDARDYYSRSSSLGFLRSVRVPTLLLSARDDPFLPPPVLDRVRDEVAGNQQLELEVTDSGGHVGFVTGSAPWRPRYYAEERLFHFLDSVMEPGHGDDYD